MSWTEIRQREGMPYGGVPLDTILAKLEETDMDSDQPLEEGYNQYARSEIVDWGPDNVFLESDHQRRDPATSRTMLNLRYAGGRGADDHLGAQHPELFIGFMGNDPRGADTQPRLEQIREHTEIRAKAREVRMGHNVGHGDFIETTRPWGGPSMLKDRVEMHKESKKRMMWFSSQLAATPGGQNVMTSDGFATRQRYATLDSGGEGLEAPSGKAFSGDPVRGAETDGVRRADRRAGADTAPWRNTNMGANLHVQRYVASTGGGQRPRGDASVLASVQAERESFGAVWDGRAANRRTLAETMSAAAAHNRAENRAAEGDMQAGRAFEAMRSGKAAAGFDAAAAARQAVAAQIANRQLENFNPLSAAMNMDAAQAARQAAPTQAAGTQATGFDPGAGRGAPSEDPLAAMHSVQTMHAVRRLASAESMVRALRTSAENRKAQGRAVADGVDGKSRETRAPAKHGQLLDVTNAARATLAPLAKAAAAGMEVARYGRAGVAASSMDTVGLTAAGGFASARAAWDGRREGVSSRPEFRGQGTAPATLERETFSAVGDYGKKAHTGGLSVGSKSLRSTRLGDKGDDVFSTYATDSLGAAISELGGL